MCGNSTVGISTISPSVHSLYCHCCCPRQRADLMVTDSRGTVGHSDHHWRRSQPLKSARSWSIRCFSTVTQVLKDLQPPAWLSIPCETGVTASITSNAVFGQSVSSTTWFPKRVFYVALDPKRSAQQTGMMLLTHALFHRHENKHRHKRRVWLNRMEPIPPPEPFHP